jgi:aspartate/methionine/tyrosine aminotransferase
VAFAKANVMPPISEDCARSWHDHMLSIGWQINNMPVLDWKAALRRWASKWNTNTQANRNNSPSNPTPHKGIQEKIEIKRLL